MSTKVRITVTYCLSAMLCICAAPAQCRAKVTALSLPTVAAEFIQTWGKVKAISVQDVGFGGQEVHLTAASHDEEPNSYTDYDVSLLVWNDQIAGVSVHAGYYLRPAVWEGLRKAIRQTGLGDVGEAHAGTFDYQRTDAARVAAYHQAVENELGREEEVVAPEGLTSACRLLTSAPLGWPVTQTVVGRNFGYAGTPPPGRTAMEALVAAKRVDLLHNVLCDINPGGRVYAAEGLLRLSRQGVPLEATDLSAISKVRSSPIKVDACGGVS